MSDASNQACSEAAGAALDEKLAKSIEEANLKTVKFPADGKLIGGRGTHAGYGASQDLTFGKAPE